MTDLVATGPNVSQSWRRKIPNGKPQRLGHAPKFGWAVPWDEQIAQEHAELVLENEQLKVRRLESAQNPIHFQGRTPDEFAMSTGQEFRIGSTTFQLLAAGETVKRNPTTQQKGSVLKSIGKYAIKNILGVGAMGTVYLAFDTQLKRNVALKILSQDKAKNLTLVKRFHSEAQAAARLQHENIVKTFDAGEAHRQLYIALEYVEGTNVDQLIIKHGSVSIKRSLHIVKQVTQALRHAYEQGIVHRDIKPSNLLITRDGTVKLADMGLARLIDESSETRITRVGTTVGTVDYMSPEQTRDSKSADVRSDIYSLGCTWYEMLIGSPPFPEGSLTNKMYAHATKARPDLRTINPDIPAATAVVLNRMMAIEPADRYQTPTELLDALENCSLTNSVPSNLNFVPLVPLADDDDIVQALVRTKKSQKNTSRRISTPKTKNPSNSGKAGSVMSLKCAKCGKNFKVHSTAAGKRLKCKNCGNPISVPKLK